MEEEGSDQEERELKREAGRKEGWKREVRGKEEGDTMFNKDVYKCELWELLLSYFRIVMFLHSQLSCFITHTNDIFNKSNQNKVKYTIHT